MQINGIQVSKSLCVKQKNKFVVYTLKWLLLKKATYEKREFETVIREIKLNAS